MPNHYLRREDRGFMVIRVDCSTKLAFLCTCLLAVSGCGKSQNVGDNSRGSTLAMADGGIEQRVDDKPVTATLRLSRARAKIGESIGVSVKLDVAAMWEIRTLDADPEIAATRLELKLPDGLQSQGEWRVPEPVRSVAVDGHPAYSGEVLFTQTVVVTKGASVGENAVQCRVTYQACNEQKCLQRTAVELNVRVRIEK